MHHPPRDMSGNSSEPGVSGVTWLAIFAVVGFWCVAVLVWIQSGPVRAADQALAIGLKIDINHDDVATLTLLPGVGQTLGEKIVAYRGQIGGFSTVDQLDDVPGIGPSVISRVRPWVTCRPLISEGRIKMIP